MGCPLAIYFKQSHLNFNVRCNNLLWDTSIIIYWDMFDVERLSYCKKLNYSRVPWYEITNAWGKVIEFPLIYHNVQKHDHRVQCESVDLKLHSSWVVNENLIPICRNCVYVMQCK